MCRVFGTWPMALLAPNKQKVIIEGPVCDSSQVIGWHLKKMNNQTVDSSSSPPLIHISSFGFNSSILWDPERWGRTSSLQSTSQVQCLKLFDLPLFSKIKLLMAYFYYVISTSITNVDQKLTILIPC